MSNETRDGDTGLRILVLELIAKLKDRGVIASSDIAEIMRLLTDVSADYDMKPCQRAQFETIAKVLNTRFGQD